MPFQSYRTGPGRLRSKRLLGCRAGSTQCGDGWGQVSPHGEVADGGAESQDDEDRDEGSETEESRADQRRARAKNTMEAKGHSLGFNVLAPREGLGRARSIP